MLVSRENLGCAGEGGIVLAGAVSTLPGALKPRRYADRFGNSEGQQETSYGHIQAGRLIQALQYTAGKLPVGYRGMAVSQLPAAI
ncbi:hypothetical protein K7432_015543 [Basidiobolus ranarum]|uniref:Uncharacterized protein n=1 Tax=Basidiobolus ranarum TaxID=34480 RepID=A0ABR2VMY3_9FUNG